MLWAKLAVGMCSALALVAAEANGGRGGRAGGAPHAGPHHAGAPHAHHVHGGAHVVVGFGGGYAYPYWPAPYYSWPGYYYPVALPPPPQYWYYCAPLAAYYPYVPSCPGPWQPVVPSPYTY